MKNLLSFAQQLPRASSAPICPSEVQKTAPAGTGFWARFRRIGGIGFFIAVGYMDPGNWATDIEAGSRFGYRLLSVVIASSIAAMLLQTLCVRLGLATGRDLATLCREQFSPRLNTPLWAFAQLAIIACDFAEVLGTALALQLLFHLPLRYGILLTAGDTFIVLGLQGRGIVRIEAIIIAFVALIGAAFIWEIALLRPVWHEVAAGMVPRAATFASPSAWWVSVGILGATVMPHNLYLHSSLVGSRVLAPGAVAKRDAVRLLTLDALLTLTLAFFVNAAILVLAAGAFHHTGHTQVTEISDAHALLSPLLGTTLAGVVFAVALFAAGQSSTFTGTIAGQVILQGFLQLRIPCWQQRLITRFTALLPAWVGIVWLGEAGLGKLLVLSQVVLSLQLPFAVVPLVLFSRDKVLMGEWRLGIIGQWVAWSVTLLIIAADGIVLFFTAL